MYRRLAQATAVVLSTAATGVALSGPGEGPAASSALSALAAPLEAPAFRAILSPHGASDTITPPNDIEYVTYWYADVRDAASCAMDVRKGKLVTTEDVSNPAMTCPDMSSWKLFTEVVRDSFWTWASDDQTWPRAPYPLCRTKDEKDCCDPDKPGVEGGPCPYFPGKFAPLQGNVPSKAHIGTAPGGDVGRVIRQSASELVFRNRPMFDYIYRNDLYNRPGVQRVFAAHRGQFNSAAPYHGADTKRLTRIDLPVNAVMIKANWLQADEARSIGIKNHPKRPFVTAMIIPQDSTRPELHYLLSFHVSSKDTPNWVWATFEHVDNPGRCDYTGCNDSYGYPSPDRVRNGSAGNYTRPHVKDDGLVQSSDIFRIGDRYPDGGAANAGLHAIFTALGIGTTTQDTTRPPKATDKGWRSYRLKGSQVNFTDAMGRPTLLGNSVTEGGFVNSSSCIGCHARAAVDEKGGSMLGVFVPRLSDVGYAQSHNGPPNPDWYVQNTSGSTGRPPALLGMQTDFLWGLPFFPDTLARPAKGKGGASGR